WARGEPLDQVVRRATMAPEPALRLAEQLLDALELSHAHGIVHGAIAPSNVIITPHGTVRLTDFATTPGLLARGTDGAAADRGPLDAARCSPFTAPERRAPGDSGAPPTEQADVWSVGACLHLALTGAPPGAAGRSLREVALALPLDVAGVVELALAADPLDRYESAYAMLGDVRRPLSGRRPNLEGALAPVPWEGLGDAPAPPRTRVSESGLHGLPTPTPTATPLPPRREWAVNLLLLLAIALLVGFATFVLVRERLSDARRSHTSD